MERPLDHVVHPAPTKAPQEAIYLVTCPMPEIGALPGDLLHAEPGHPDWPLVLTRHFDRNLLPFVLDERVTLCSVGGDPVDPPTSAPPSPPEPTAFASPRHLRLVR